MALASSANIWGCNSQNEIFYWNYGQWQKSDGACREISVAQDGAVWCCNSADEVWVKRNGPHSPWERQNQRLHKISARSRDEAVGLSRDGGVWGMFFLLLELIFTCFLSLLWKLLEKIEYHELERN